MERLLPVALDTAGGDHGITPAIEGAICAASEFGIRTILVGPNDDLNRIIRSFGAEKYLNDGLLSIEHAPDVITMDDSPAMAVRRKPKSSLCVAFNLLEQGIASSAISAGNSGAMMAAGTFITGLLGNIERPAIASLIPGIGDSKPNVVLDVGANVGSKSHHLVQFAVMGSIYYSCLFPDVINSNSQGTVTTRKPRVALLSNGTEPSKGTDVIRGAAGVLNQMESINYVGFIEGRDISTDTVDVIVCDGFVGNVMLKSIEGSVRLISEHLNVESKKTLSGQIGLWFLKNTHKKIFHENLDYSSLGGAPLLGLRKLGVVLHGSSKLKAFKFGVKSAEDFSRQDLPKRIGEALVQLEQYFPEDLFGRKSNM